MNGRVYDYNLGKFMSVDPFIQSPTNSQSFNPYSYIMNNPLAGTDPTGYVSVGTNASNWRTSACDLDPMGCVSTPVDRALDTYVGGGQSNMHQSLVNNLQKFSDKMEKGVAAIEQAWSVYASAFGSVTITDLTVEDVQSGWSDQDGNPSGPPSVFNGTETACICIAGGLKNSQQIANEHAATSALQKGINNLKENIRGNTETSDSDQELYGPFYRYETEQKWVDQALQQGMLYGQQPLNGGAWPSIQAYRMDISPYKPGRIEFYTTVKPASGGGPIQHWYPSTPGVMVHDEKTIKIPIIVHAAIPVDQLIR